jgi:HEPN domain-containing protein
MKEHSKIIMEWKRLSDMDLSIANHLFELHRPMPIEGICFHAQQTAEKMLKCFLVYNEIEPPKIHDMRELIEMCIEIEDGFNVIYNESTSLTKYAVLPRYPAELELEEADAERAIRYATKVGEYVKGLLFSPTEEEITP